MNRILFGVAGPLVSLARIHPFYTFCRVRKVGDKHRDATSIGLDRPKLAQSCCWMQVGCPRGSCPSRMRGPSPLRQQCGGIYAGVASINLIIAFLPLRWSGRESRHRLRRSTRRGLSSTSCYSVAGSRLLGLRVSHSLPPSRCWSYNPRCRPHPSGGASVSYQFCIANSGLAIGLLQCVGLHHQLYGVRSV